MTDVHQRLVTVLGDAGARFRIVEHGAEGRSVEISRIRGNDPGQAMKALVVELRGGGQGRRHVLAVVPGDRKLDMKALRKLYGAQKGRFANPETAQSITGCVMGAVPPFSFSEDLALVVDEDLRRWPEVCFNAGRLDRSIFVDFDGYQRAAAPAFAAISDQT